MVNFIICGTQKGGTTALYTYLSKHPEVCMSTKKEVHFFDNRRSNYSKYFNPEPHHKVLGEATPIYMYWKSCPKKIYQYNPNIKLIILLRNPIERAYSHWNMEFSRNIETLPFWEAIVSEPSRYKDQHRVFSYTDRGFYIEQLRRIWKYFKKEQVLILKSEELQYNTKICLDNICNFLEISNFDLPTINNTNKSSYISKMTKKEERFLIKLFKPSIKELEKELNWDCSNWFDETSKS